MSIIRCSNQCSCSFLNACKCCVIYKNLILSIGIDSIIELNKGFWIHCLRKNCFCFCKCLQIRWYCSFLLDFINSSCSLICKCEVIPDTPEVCAGFQFCAKGNLSVITYNESNRNIKIIVTIDEFYCGIAHAFPSTSIVIWQIAFLWELNCIIVSEYNRNIIY